MNFHLSGYFKLELAISDPVKQKYCFDQASGYLRSGNAQMAAKVCDAGLREFPGDANILCLSAKANLALKRFTESKECLEEAIRLFPDFASAHETYGDLLLVQGFADAAIEAYGQALRLDPTRADTHRKLDKARELASTAQGASGEVPGPKALRHRMAFEEEIARALAFENDGEPNKAEDIYRDILVRDPDHVEAARLLAAIAVEHERYHDAEVYLLRVVDNAPDYGRAWVDLANVQQQLEKFEEAEECARQVLRLGPDKAESHMIFAGVIGTAGRHEEAIESYQKALEIDPKKYQAISGMAHHLKTIGLQDDAIATYRQCIAEKPDHTEAYWSLANLKTFRFEDAEVDAMEALLADKELNDTARVHLHNALGFAYEARRDFDRAFSNFERCNKIRRLSESYDPVELEDAHDRIIGMFNAVFLRQKSGNGFPDDAPIFVVGLPRSGSTLIEQILSSHSLVEGTHELSDLSRVVHQARRASRGKRRFPEMLEKFAPGDWRSVGENYIDRTMQFRSGHPNFIDKNPNNFEFIGLLGLALPNAKIINARRHPLDSCFGTYKQLFAKGQPFSYDLTELGEYYLEYRRLMDHWYRVLPGKVLDVNYEEVVADLDTQVRRMLDYCQLPFEQACLRFHETERAVKTASSEQVRQPIYTSSVNLWRNYETHLSELIRVLEPLLRDLPDDDQPSALRINQK
jgi:tetratricopeptide (TPR) repeat protein